MNLLGAEARLRARERWSNLSSSGFPHDYSVVRIQTLLVMGSL